MSLRRSTYLQGFAARPPKHGRSSSLRSPLQEDAPRRGDVVVGLGNEIVHDDGVGIVAAERLRRRLRSRADVEVVSLPWGGFALLDVLAGCRRAVLLDCLTTGRYPPGTVVRLDESDFRGSVRLNSFHDIDYPTVLQLGRRMGYAMPEEVAVWAVEAAEVSEFGEGLSAPVGAAVDRVVNEVISFLDKEHEVGASGTSGLSGAVP